jgi:hypothetical protein
MGMFAETAIIDYLLFADQGNKTPVSVSSK